MAIDKRAKRDRVTDVRITVSGGPERGRGIGLSPAGFVLWHHVVNRDALSLVGLNPIDKEFGVLLVILRIEDALIIATVFATGLRPRWRRPRATPVLDVIFHRLSRFNVRDQVLSI